MDKIAMQTKKVFPQIYVFEDRHEPGWLKVGYTEKENAEDRVREQFNTRLQLDKNPYILHHVEDAIDIRKHCSLYIGIIETLSYKECI